MSLKSVSSFAPAQARTAQWVDKKVGNADGHVDAGELHKAGALLKQDTSKAKFKALADAYTQSTGVAVPPTGTELQGGAPVAVGQGKGVLGFRLAAAGGAAPAAAASSSAAVPYAGDVARSLPVDKLTQVGASASGDVFHLDSHGVAGMEVRARQFTHPTHGAGTELSLRLTTATSAGLSQGIAEGKVPGMVEAPFQLEKADFAEGATRMAATEMYQPKGPDPNNTYGTVDLKAHKLEEAGKWSVEFVPHKDRPQAYRDKVRVRVFGATDAEREKNLQAALKAVQLGGVIDDASGEQTERLVRLSALRMVAPVKAEEMGAALAGVSIKDLDKELAAAGVPAEALKGVQVKEVFGGHMAPVMPWLGEQYEKLGVRGVMSGVREVDFAVKILTSDGLMSSLERYSRGIHKAGASMTSDEASGGAEFAFTRLVTDAAVKDSKSITSSFGAGAVQLVSTGAPMKELLSRTDWHAYANDSYGVTVSRSQAEGPAADTVAKKEFDKRTSKFSDRPVLADLVGQVEGTQKAPGSYSSGWAQSNEACFKNGVAAQAFTHAIVQNEATRTDLITKLKAAGLTEIAGKSVEDFVILANNWKEAGAKLGFPAPAAPPAA